MKKALVGYKGFVGSNIIEGQNFDKLYDKENIESIQNEEYDLVIWCAGKAEKFLANKNPEQDLEHIKELIKMIGTVKTKRFVLISTIDVYKNPFNVDEDTFIDEEELHPYGLHKRYLEKWVLENMENPAIIRLPALYGKNLKKNFIYDIMTIIPAMLNEEKYIQTNKKYNLSRYYTKQENGFYKLNELNNAEKVELKTFFENNDFNSLSFTDSRNKYPFYNLSNLYNHIQHVINNNIRIMNICTEPVSAGEIYKFIKGEEFVNIIMDEPVNYNIKTKHSELFGGKNGYIYNKEQVLEDIKGFFKGV